MTHNEYLKKQVTAEQTDTNKNLKMCTQSEKNWLTVSSSNPNPHGLVLSYTVLF